MVLDERFFQLRLPTFLWHAFHAFPHHIFSVVSTWWDILCHSYHSVCSATWFLLSLRLFLLEFFTDFFFFLSLPHSFLPPFPSSITVTVDSRNSNIKRCNSYFIRVSSVVEVRGANNYNVVGTTVDICIKCNSLTAFLCGFSNYCLSLNLFGSKAKCRLHIWALSCVALKWKWGVLGPVSHDTAVLHGLARNLSEPQI